MENFITELKSTIKKSQVEILKLKDTIMENKNSISKFKNSLDTGEESINDLEDSLAKNIQMEAPKSKKRKRKMMENTENSI